MTRQHQSALSRLGFRDPDKEDPKHGLACEYLQEKMRPYVAEEICRLYEKFARAILIGSNGDSTFITYDTPCYADETRCYRCCYEETLEVAWPAIRAFQEVVKNAIRAKTFDGGELSSMIVGPQSGAKGFLDVSFRGNLMDQLILPPSLPAVGETYDDKIVPAQIDLNDRSRSLWQLHPRVFNRQTEKFKFCFWGEVRIQPTAPELLLQQIEFYANNLGRSDMIWVLADFDLSDFKRMASTQFPQLKCFQLGEKFEEWCENRARPEIPEL